MIKSLNGKTIRNSFTLEGRGLHSGDPVTVKVNPGETGIAFRIGDERIPALAENVSDTTRCTCLGPVRTVEHLMSALAGMGITDAEVEVSAPELPGLDGSSLPFAQSIESVGIEILGMREFYVPFSRVFFQEEDISISLSSGEGQWQFEFVCDERWPHRQVFETKSLEKDYLTEIAPARTFAFEEEIPFIQKAGLAKGLDESSALILGKENYLNQARFHDEPVRHKLLDLIGDLTLTGIPAGCVNVCAARSGHRTNVLAAQKIRTFWFAELQNT